jgi:hypothetical protein
VEPVDNFFGEPGSMRHTVTPAFDPWQDTF